MHIVYLKKKKSLYYDLRSKLLIFSCMFLLLICMVSLHLLYEFLMSKLHKFLKIKYNSCILKELQCIFYLLVPMVLKCCAEFIEEYGVVDGIYRLSGVSSNIQRLRYVFNV